MADVKRTLDENGWIKYTVTSEKSLVDYIVSKKEDGFSSYIVSLSKGSVPASLSGVYTTPDKALKALLGYVRNMKETTSVQRDNKYKANQEYKKASKNASAEVLTDNQSKVQQGTPD